MTTRLAVLLAFAAAACHPARPQPTPATPAPVDAGAAITQVAPACHPITTLDGTDPAKLGLEVCAAPTPSGDDVTITIRRTGDPTVLWSDTAIGLSRAEIVGLGSDDPPGIQLNVIARREGTADDEGEDDDLVIDLELSGGAIHEVSRFVDSGD